MEIIDYSFISQKFNLKVCNIYIHMHFQMLVTYTHFFFHYSLLLDKLLLIFTASSLQQDLRPCQGKENVNSALSLALLKPRLTC